VSLSRRTEREATVLAHAKLNLSLRVLHQRPDKFHELRTVFQTISLADEIAISFSPDKQTEIVIADNAIPDNLIERAAHLCLQEMGLHARVVFALKKRIPMGAGLGGGSSDAAAVLLALPALAGKAVPIERLAAIGASLGSDVPFFLFGGTALGLGKGEELYPLPDAKLRFGIIVAPDIHVSTPDAYRDLSQVLGDPAPKLASFQRGCWESLGFEAVNDFEEAVFARHPRLGEIKKSLIRRGADVAMMTGSGSAIFAFFPTKETLRHVVQSLGEERVYPIRLLSARSYRRDWLRRLEPHIKGSVNDNLWPPRSRYVR
jgi:4-diphosphocytidyl-2-C-methyl-D-erythritol kinase